MFKFDEVFYVLSNLTNLMKVGQTFISDLYIYIYILPSFIQSYQISIKFARLGQVPDHQIADANQTNLAFEYPDNEYTREFVSSIGPNRKRLLLKNVRT